MSGHRGRAALMLGLWGLLGQVAWAASPVVTGSFESARTPDDEFVRVILSAKGKATIVAEHNFQIPGDASKRRGRTTTYGHWQSKGDVVTLTYSKVTERLRYEAAAPLRRIGLEGSAPALSPMKPTNAKSRLKNQTLWRVPHTYRLPEGDADAARLAQPAN